MKRTKHMNKQQTTQNKHKYYKKYENRAKEREMTKLHLKMWKMQF